MGCLQSSMHRSKSDNSDVEDRLLNAPDSPTHKENVNKLIVERLKDSCRGDEKSELVVNGTHHGPQLSAFKGEEELFGEILYQNFHPITNDVTKSQQAVNVQHLKEAFVIDKESLQKVVDEASNKKEVEKRLNFRLIEATGFEAKGKGVNCRIYLKRKPEEKVETKILPDKKALAWNFHASMLLASAETDVLVLEMWTHPAKGKKSNLSCSVELPLKNMPLAGKDEWANLSKKKRKVHVFMAVGAAKEAQVALREHRQLARVLLRYRLQREAAPFAWNGTLSDTAENILNQHRAHSSLSELQALLARWAGYCDHHQESPFNFEVLETTLNEILAKEDKSFNEEETKLLWNFKPTVLQHCLDFIRNMFKLSETCGKVVDAQLNSMLRILSKLLPIKSTEDLHASSKHRSQNFGLDDNAGQIRRKMRYAIKDCAQEWVHEIFSTVASDKDKLDKKAPPPEQKNDLNDAEKEEIVQILVNCSKDINEIKDFATTSPYDEKFKPTGIDFAKAVMEVFDTKVHEVVKPLVMQLCKKLQSIKPIGQVEVISQDNYKYVIELYCSLKGFVKIGEASFGDRKMKCCDFHTWFTGGVHEQWLDIIFIKALSYIDGAIDKDIVEPDMKCTSCVLDVLEIFKMLQNHITSLQGSNEGNEMSTMTLGMVEKLARCTEYFTDRMVTKLAQAKNEEQKTYFTMNNIEGVRTRGLEPMLKKMSIETAFANVNKIGSASEHCHEVLKALKRVVETSQYTENKLRTMAKSLSKILLTRFIEDNFLTEFGFMNKSVAICHLENLENHLSDYNYKLVLSIFSSKIVKYFEMTISKAKSDRKPPIYFANLKQSLDDFEKDFITEKNLSCGKEVEKLKKSLGQLSVDPVHQFCLERLSTLNDVVDGSSNKGQIKLSVQINQNDLSVKVLNAKNLKNNKDLCNPYVSVRLHPQHNFSSASRMKTQIKRGVPSESVDFEDAFNFTMEKHVENAKDNVVHLLVKDFRRFGKNKVIGETAISFEKIGSNIDLNGDTLGSPEIEMPLLKLADSPSGKVVTWQKVARALSFK